MLNNKEIDLKELSIEEIFALLEEAVKKLEDKEISLEESFSCYAKGMEMIKSCNEKIDSVEKKMLQINENGDYSEF
ncbi:MAG TPA: exodeoxyribonuclease VII small subunit [Lachnospiraceae bacterium]